MLLATISKSRVIHDEECTSECRKCEVVQGVSCSGGFVSRFNFVVYGGVAPSSLCVILT